MLKEEIKVVRSISDKKELKKFGYVIGVFLGLLALLLFWKDKSSAIYFAYISGSILFLGIVYPIALKPLYISWMSFAVVLGFFMTRLILSLLFILVFTPAGIAIRLLGKDPLDQKIEKQKSSYWIKRDRKPYNPDSTEKQY